jgi:outer membrane protein
MRKLYIFVTTIILLTTAHAQPKRKTFEFSIGPGVVAKTSTRFDNSYDQSDKPTNIRLIPFMNLKLGPVALRGGGIQVNLGRYLFISPYLSFSRDGERYYGEGMDRRKDSWFLGGGMRIAFFNIEYKKDVQSRSEGATTSMSVGKMFHFGDFMIRPSLGASYRNSNYNNYYYGVRAHEVTSSRALYLPEGSWAYSLSSSFIYPFEKKMSASFIVNHTLLGSEVDNSPTTRKDTETAFILGFAYSVL